MGDPHTKFSKVVSIDERLRSYRIRLTPKWVARTSTKADKSAVVSKFFFQLASDLRSIELTASMPHTVVRQLDHFVTGFMAGADDTGAQKAARLIAARLVGRLKISDAAMRDNIMAECLQISAEIESVRKVPAFSANEIWQNYLSLKGFRLGLSASQAFGIAAAYNAYENFFVRCVGAALGMSGYRKKSDKRFAEKVIQAFGQSICDQCFMDEQVQLLRCLRHAIAHNGGRETPDLVKLRHPFNVVDEHIQFMPQHTVVSLRIVEARVTDLVEAAIKHLKFVTRRK